MTSTIEYMKTNGTYIIFLILQHLKLTSVAIFIAIILGVPIGILINRYSKFDKPILGTVNVIQAIPSLALLGFFIPFLGIGVVPAIVVVIMYSLLPIIKNTYIGLKNINPQTLEAARGIGMTKMQVLFKVQIPLALPVIMGGIRIASVTAVGLMTMAAFIGAGGLGELVFAGIQTVNNAKILAGAFPACILALTIDFLLSKVEKLVTPLSMIENSVITKESILNRKRKILYLVITFITVVSLLIGNLLLANVKKEKSIIIGSKNYTEQIILSNIFSILIEENTDIKVVKKFNLGGTKICFDGMNSGDIDMYVEYSGTAYMNILEQKDNIGEEKTYEYAKKELKNRFDLEYLDPLGFNNTYILAVTKETANKYNLKNISDLKKYSENMTLSGSVEFANREDGLIGLKKAYDLAVGKSDPVDGGLRYVALNSGKSDIIDAYSTDGLLVEFQLVTLEDDKNFFPPYYAAPLVKNEILNEYPQLNKLLNSLAGKFSDEKMRTLNYKVDVKGEDPAIVAKEFLQSENLIK